MIVLDVILLHDKHITFLLSSKKKQGRNKRLQLESLILHKNCSSASPLMFIASVLVYFN